MNQPSTVLLVGATPPPITGLGVANEMVLAALRTAGCPVIHINPKQVDFSVGRFNWRKVVEAGRLLVQVQSAVRKLRCYRAYVTLSQSPLGMIRDMFTIWLIQRCAERVVVHIHGSQLQQGFAALPRPLRRLYAKWVGRCDAALVLTDIQKGNFEGIVPHGRVFTVSNAYKTDEVATGEQIQQRIADLMTGRPIRCLFIGTIWAEKGYRDVLTAMALLKELGTEVHVKLAGGFSSVGEREWCLQFIQQNSLDEMVDLLGPVRSEEKRAAMRWADVSVLPSHLQEGVPLSLLEGMASGHFLLATRMGGIVDIINGPVCGSFIPVKDPQAIADQLQMLAVKRDVLKRAATTNPTVAYERYSEEAFSGAILRFVLAGL